MILISFPVRRKHNTNLLFHLSSHYILMVQVLGEEHWHCWSRFINSLTGAQLLGVCGEQWHSLCSGVPESCCCGGMGGMSLSLQLPAPCVVSTHLAQEVPSPVSAAAQVSWLTASTDFGSKP